MRYCKLCVMPDTKPDLSFDSEGVCDACRSAQWKETFDWKQREKEFIQLVKEYKSKDGMYYDCILPVSGGKDSHYQVYMAKKYGLNPLCVHFEPSMPTELGKKNLMNLRTAFGVDVISWLKNPVIYRKLCIEGFKRVGDPEWPNHLGIFTVPVKMAVKFKIPLILWGENTQLEYGGPKKAREQVIFDKRYLFEYGGLLGNRLEDMACDDIPYKELRGLFYPSEDELKKAHIRGVFLGYYFKWDARPQTDFMIKHGFSTKGSAVEGTYTDYENLDCESSAIHDYMKYPKYGFGRTTDHACLDVRNGRITRQEAVALVNRYDGAFPWYGARKMMEYLGMDEKELISIMDSFTNKNIFKTDSKGRFVKLIDKTLVKRDECMLQ